MRYDVACQETKHKGGQKMEQKFQTIRQTAKLGILSEYNLRLRLAQGRLPGVYAGNRFMVNVPMLMQKLDAESEQGGAVNAQ